MSYSTVCTSELQEPIAALLGNRTATTSAKARAVIAIRIDHIDKSELLIESPNDFTLFPGVPEGRELFTGRTLAVIKETGGYIADRDVFSDSAEFAAPAWMLREAGVSTADSQGKVLAFHSGLLLLTPDGGLAAESRLDESQVRRLAWQNGFEFPRTSIGRQLQQVAWLIAVDASPVKLFVASMSGPGNQAKQLVEAMAAFHYRMLEIGVDSEVITYTEPAESTGEKLRLVMGGNVMGGEIYTVSRQQSEAYFADWARFGVAESLAAA